jgi:hypothetical protein
VEVLNDSLVGRDKNAENQKVTTSRRSGRLGTFISFPAAALR